MNRILKFYISNDQMFNMPNTQIQLRSLVVNGKISLIKCRWSRSVNTYNMQKATEGLRSLFTYQQ